MAKAKPQTNDPDAPHVHDWINDETGIRDLPIGQSSDSAKAYYRDPEKSHTFTCKICGRTIRFGSPPNPLKFAGNGTWV
jgi:hypothetical protein